MKKTVFIAFSALITWAACKPSTKNTTQTPAQDTQTAPTPTVEQPVDTAGQKEQLVEITTAAGKIVLKLYNETPQHRDNFIKLVKDGYYTDLLFHRVIKGFMIQGGDPDSKNAKPGQQLGAGDIGYTIPAEINNKLIHKKGALAAARTENPEKRSSGCQFYIVQGQQTNPDDLQNMAYYRDYQYTPEQLKAYEKGGAPSLDGQYTVFGEVVSGLNVVDAIANQAVDGFSRPFSDIRFTIKLKE